AAIVFTSSVKSISHTLSATPCWLTHLPDNFVSYTRGNAAGSLFFPKALQGDSVLYSLLNLLVPLAAMSFSEFDVSSTSKVTLASLSPLRKATILLGEIDLY